ncbi:MAG TPA: bifunctional UDP-N-acetylglucosamine diphosphorylase/glucosamine-1-phosphate N-acetyltransferase GlmU [Polyangia bacterium]
MSRGLKKDKNSLACLILAAGKGTRMYSARAKMLHSILGVPLVSYPVERAIELHASPIVAVLGHQRAEVEKALLARHGQGTVTVVEQAEQKGTGHAVRLGLQPLRRWEGTVLILYGDVPLLSRETLTALVKKSRAKGALVMLTAQVPHPFGYGRVVRDSQGRITKVVEHKDANEEERQITEVNAGIYAAPADFLRQTTARLSPRNAQGELYLTDIIAKAAGGIGTLSVDVSAEEMAGINDRQQLAAVEKILSRRIVQHWMKHATFRDPETAWVEASVTIDGDAEIGRNVVLRGHTKIGAGARIEDGCVLTDTEVGAGAVFLPYSIASQSAIGPGAKIGPFAHLRPGTELGPDVHVGNYVETKKTRMGRGSKANHLTYLGDTIIGEKVNVGAGTITCNYNGYEKRQTIIEDGAFIGSDTQLVAPVRVGKRAVVAAGSTITEDIRDGALALTRAPLKQIDGYADKVAARYATKAPKPTKR